MNNAANTATRTWMIVDSSCRPGEYLDELENATREEARIWFAQFISDEVGESEEHDLELVSRS